MLYLRLSCLTMTCQWKLCVPLRQRQQPRARNLGLCWQKRSLEEVSHPLQSPRTLSPAQQCQRSLNRPMWRLCQIRRPQQRQQENLATRMAVTLSLLLSQNSKPQQLPAGLQALPWLLTAAALRQRQYKSSHTPYMRTS